MELLRPQYTKFDPFFCKMLNVHILLTFGGSGKLFFRGSVVSRNMWFAAENVVLMGNPYVLKGSSPFAKYVVCRGKCGSNGESICFGGELSRGKCGSSGQMNHIFRETPRVRKESLFSEGKTPQNMVKLIF